MNTLSLAALAAVVLAAAPDDLAKNSASPPRAADAPMQANATDPFGFPRDDASLGFDEEPLGPLEDDLLTEPEVPSGFFLPVGAEYAWLAKDGSSGFGIQTVAINGMLPIPLGGKRIVLVTPSFEYHAWDSPDDLHLPDDVFDANLNFLMPMELSERWDLMVMGGFGYSSDFHQSSADAWRFFAMGMAEFHWTEQLDVALGAVFLDRDDYPVLPLAGLTWRPTPDWEINVGLPKPRVARRLATDLRGGDIWTFVGLGGIGGGQWYVRRPDGVARKVTYGDIQLVWGLEWSRGRRGAKGVFEVGYAFNREIEIEGEAVGRDFDDTLVLKMGFHF